MKRLSGLLVGALAAMPAYPAPASPAKYTFVRIADSTAFGAISYPVALSDTGAVVFVSTLPTGVTGVFVGSGGPVTTVADTTRVFSFFGFPSINGQGEATFFGNKVGRSGFYQGTDGGTVLVENRGAVVNFQGDIRSSPSGAFSTGHAFLRLPGLPQEIVVGTGGRATRIVDTSGLFADLDRDPRVNAAGRVAFHGTRRGGGEGIFVGAGGGLTTIADTSGPFAAFLDRPAINDRGDVLFQAFRADFTLGLFLSHRGEVIPLLDSTGEIIDFGLAPALNARGQIAFQGTTATGLVGIFTGGDPLADRVIAVGDALDGSTVDSFAIQAFDSALNDRGQLAFIVTLADGRTGVYRADPARRAGP